MGKGKGKGYFNIAPMDSHIHSLSAKGVKTQTLKMMDLATIRKMNRDVGRKAQSENKQPYIVTDATTFEDIRHIPNFGDYRPKGWKLVETYFVDSSGFGAPNEPALTIDEFMNKLKKGHGYAIVEAGQFQVYIAEFVKTRSLDAKAQSWEVKMHKTAKPFRASDDEYQQWDIETKEFRTKFEALQFLKENYGHLKKREKIYRDRPSGDPEHIGYVYKYSDEQYNQDKGKYDKFTEQDWVELRQVNRKWVLFAKKQYTIVDAMRKNKQVGQYFFSEGAMHFFNSRIETHGNLINNKYFVTSEKAPVEGSSRKYTVRQFVPKTGDIKTIGKFQQFWSKEDAEMFARLQG